MQLVIVFYQRFLRIGQSVVGVSRLVDPRFTLVGVFHVADGVNLRFHGVRRRLIRSSLFSRGFQSRVACFRFGQFIVIINQRLLLVGESVIRRSCGVNFVLAFVGVFHLADGVDQVVDRVRIDKVGVNFKCCRDGRSADGHREAFVSKFDLTAVFIGNGERRKAEAQLRCNRQVDRFAHSGGLFVCGDRAVFCFFHIHGIQYILPYCRDDHIAVHGDRVAGSGEDGPADCLYTPAAESLARRRSETAGRQSEAAAGDDSDAVHLAAAAVRVKGYRIELSAVQITADGAGVVVAREGVRRLRK